MDRFTDADPNERIPFWRTFNVEGATVRGEDDDLLKRIDLDGNELPDGEVGQPPGPGAVYIDRRDREHVCYYQDSQGRWKPTHLKRGDHVIAGGLPLEVIGPAGGREVFFGYYNAWFGDERLPIEVKYVYDRAPLDPNEPAMPVIPAEEPAPPVAPEPPPAPPAPPVDEDQNGGAL